MTPSAVALADRLCVDIRRRNLKPGDTYLTTSEAALMLNVSKARANRAMQVLAARQILQRGRGSLPIVGQGELESERSHQINKVHILIPRADIDEEGLYSDGCLVGLQRALPNAIIHLDYYPKQDEGRFTSEVISDSSSRKELAAFVLVRSSLETQLAIAESKIPAIVHGTPYRGVEGLTSIDRNNEQTAKLMVSYLKEKGCKQFLLLLRTERVYAGGYDLHEVLLSELVKQGIPFDAIKTRFSPEHILPVRANLRQIMDADRSRLGVVAFGGPLAQDCLRAMSDLHLVMGQDVELIYSGHYESGPRAIEGVPHVQNVPTAHEEGELVGRLLQSRAESPDSPPQQVKMDVKLAEA